MRTDTFSFIVYKALESGPATLKELTQKCDMPYQRVSNCIFNLKDFGRIERIAPGTYQIREKRSINQ